MTESPDPAESVSSPQPNNVLEPTNSEVLVEAHKMTDDLDKKTNLRQGKITVAVIIMCIVDILLVFGVIVAVSKVENTDAQLQQVQQVTSTQVLCPLYVRLKANEGTTLKSQYPNPADYNSIVQQIQHGIDVLGCSHS